MLDVLVVGGGPAGLSAAMLLGRCRRSVLVVDAGTPRNARSHALHGAECYGSSLFHCPYCDAWEVRDEMLAVYARGRRGVGLALALQTWSRDVVLCTDGPARLRREEAGRLRARGITVREELIARLEHSDGQLERVVFRDGGSIARTALFFNTAQYTRSPLAERLGCRFTSNGAVRSNDLGATNVRGLYVAGDASRDVQLVVVAAAEGAKVAYAMNVELQKLDSRGRGVAPSD